MFVVVKIYDLTKGCAVMRLMHTKLPEFIKKMKTACTLTAPEKKITIRGLENLHAAKMQSLRTGRIEYAIEELAASSDIEEVEMVVIPRVPETMHTVILKGIDKDGKTHKAILETINILHPTEEAELINCQDITDRRPSLGQH